MHLHDFPCILCSKEVVYSIKLNSIIASAIITIIIINVIDSCLLMTKCDLVSQIQITCIQRDLYL